MHGKFEKYGIKVNVFFSNYKTSVSLYYTNMYSEFLRERYNMQHFFNLLIT